jgi:hypothetical protein
MHVVCDASDALPDIETRQFNLPLPPAPAPSVRRTCFFVYVRKTERTTLHTRTYTATRARVAGIWSLDDPAAARPAGIFASGPGVISSDRLTLSMFQRILSAMERTEPFNIYCNCNKQHCTG